MVAANPRPRPRQPAPSTARARSTSTSTASGSERFDELETIGEGSYGVVVKARDRNTGRMVALKKFTDQELDATTQRELEALKRVQHPNVCALVAAFTDPKAGGRLRIAMEYVGGGSLLPLLGQFPRGVRPWPRARSIIRSLSEAVQGMHLCGVIHRDLKPENVLLCEAGGATVKLCDLGDATWVTSGEPRTSYVATRWYRAPELLCRQRQYGAAIDVWALGTIAFELLSGDAIFCEKTDAAQLAAVQRCLGPLPDIFAARGVAIAPAEPAASVAARLAAADAAAAATGSDGGGAAELQSAEAFVRGCLQLEASARPTAARLLAHPFLAAPPPRATPMRAAGGGRLRAAPAAPAAPVAPRSPPRRSPAAGGRRCETPAKEVEEEVEEVLGEVTPPPPHQQQQQQQPHHQHASCRPPLASLPSAPRTLAISLPPATPLPDDEVADECSSRNASPVWCGGTPPRGGLDGVTADAAAGLDRSGLIGCARPRDRRQQPRRF